MNQAATLKKKVQADSQIANKENNEEPPKYKMFIETRTKTRKEVQADGQIAIIGSYHSTAIQINLKNPTRGIVSKGIGLEVFYSVLAGLWGTGTGATTLTENIHSIDAMKVASRRAVELGAALLIILSFVGMIQ